jgi:tRNA-Thr(GGU) m(6)t(6)A37 methyltransferase TsaA
MQIKPIAFIETDFKEKFGIPRQSGRVNEVISKIVFEPEFRNPDALRGIDGFSHLWLIFDFSLSHTEKFSPTVRPPRLGGNQKVGVFASRSPFRPNSIGLSSVKLISVEKTENQGDVLIVAGADLLDKTPIYDIKPYLPFTDCHPDAKGGFADEKKGYEAKVIIPEKLCHGIDKTRLEEIRELLLQDPRPSYRQDEEREYGMSYAGFEISFIASDDIITVTSIKYTNL